jgi:hypothetical protein
VTLLDVFHGLVAAHIAFGAVGLVAVWVPIVGRKGGEAHRRFGRIFIVSMLVTGGFAMGMGALTILAPEPTHPHLVGRYDAAFVAGIFGHMMLYLAFLTINLALQGHLAIAHKRDRAPQRSALNLASQGLLFALAANCAVRGVLIGQPLMIGISLVGFATAGTNLHYLLKAQAGPQDWLKEHIKALVGAGISVYTAFFAFGAVRLMPSAALSPLLWAAPLVTGLSIILYHHAAVNRRLRGRRRTGDAAA